LAGNLIWAEQVIRIQPLDVITATSYKGIISGGSGALICLRKYPHYVRFKGPRHGQGLILGAVIDDNNFLSIPRLRYCRPKRVSKPPLSVVCRDKDRY
jgi:hypothetical protein